jgi:hypothetical protein
MHTFMKDLRADSRYTNSLVVLMVENNLSEIAVSHFWAYVRPYAPIMLATHNAKSGRLQFGMRTTNDLKMLMIQKAFRLLETLRIRFDHKLIGRNAYTTKELLKTELQNIVLTPKGKDEKTMYEVSGKHAGPDDVAICAMLGFVNREHVVLQEDYKRVVPELFRPEAETEDAPSAS